MGHYKKGILGGFSGKVGTVVGSSWKGIEYIRSRPAFKKSRTFSQPQLEQQAKFSVAGKLVRSMSDLLNITFKDATGMTGANSAMRYNISNAVEGTYPVYTISFPNVSVSRGALPLAEGAGAENATASMPGYINFIWNNNSGAGRAKASDRAVLVAYCESLQTAIYSTNAGTRSTGTASLQVSLFSGKTVHTYLSFISDDGKVASDSVYTGVLLVP